MPSTSLRAPGGARTDLTPHLPELHAALIQQRQFRSDQLAELLGNVATHTTATALDPHDEVTVALHAGAAAALADIETALSRMNTGEYGRCQRCAAAIPIARLEVLPAAPLCMPCQHTAEASQWPHHRRG